MRSRPNQDWSIDYTNCFFCLRGVEIVPSTPDAQLFSNGSLRLSSLQTRDAGEYVCQVKNPYGEDKIVYNLNVVGK